MLEALSSPELPVVGSIRLFGKDGLGTGAVHQHIHYQHRVEDVNCVRKTPAQSNLSVGTNPFLGYSEHNEIVLCHSAQKCSDVP
jgi:hypothetical protein